MFFAFAYEIAIKKHRISPMLLNLYSVNTSMSCGQNVLFLLVILTFSFMSSVCPTAIVIKELFPFAAVPLKVTSSTLFLPFA
mgnify:CR=1 FL=1